MVRKAILVGVRAHRICLPSVFLSFHLASQACVSAAGRGGSIGTHNKKLVPLRALLSELHRRTHWARATAEEDRLLSDLGEEWGSEEKEKQRTTRR